MDDLEVGLNASIVRKRHLLCMKFQVAWNVENVRDFPIRNNDTRECWKGK